MAQAEALDVPTLDLEEGMVSSGGKLGFETQGRLGYVTGVVGRLRLQACLWERDRKLLTVGFFTMT